MATLRCDFFSEALALSTSLTVRLPDLPATRPPADASAARRPLPQLLYLLHGLSDDDTTWLRRTSLDRYVSALDLVVVMPQVHRSYYTDEAYGGRYWTYLTEELPQLVQQFFRVSARRQDTFVAGLSMGGYGAMKWALRQPERFAAAASLSGALDVASPSTRRFRPEDPKMFRRIFGEPPIAGSDNDLLTLVGRADPAELPRLGLWCGSEDGVLPANLRFQQTCAAAEVPLTSQIGPGSHEWGYWDAKIQEVLDWLPLRSTAAHARG